MSPLQQVLASNMCTGCGLCVASPRDMQIDEKGFSRPLAFVGDALSLAACPGLALTQTNRENYDSSWGPIVSAQVGYAADPEIRRMGSSGGVLTALLSFLLHEKYIDAVIQTGASRQSPLANETFVVSDPRELVSNAGSRYAPSSPLAVIRKLIGNGKKYAVVGKPCDIAALRAAMRVDAQIKHQFPILLSFMCAGVPSEHAARAIVEHMGLAVGDIATFRYRGDGWPGLTRAETVGGAARTMTYNEAWGTILNKDLQARCKVCADGTGELADLVCADAWYVSRNGYPSFEEKDGRSLILARTPLGQELLGKAIRHEFIEGVADFALEGLPAIQPYQFNRKRTALIRQVVLRLCGVRSPRFKGFDLWRLFLRTPPLVSAKAAAGTLLRKMKGRL